MDITSYLLGKKAGGGSTPTLQTKSVTITENTTTEVTPDSGYDGLEKVNVTTNVPSGGGSAEEKDVDFIDYDGTLLHSYTKAEFLALTEMPSNPSHEGLTAQGWNWSLSDAKTYVTNYGMLVIGQSYITDDETTRLYVDIMKNALQPTISLGINGSVTIDWGDNNTSTVTGSNLSTRVDTNHTYSSAGKYIIKISRNTNETNYNIIGGNSTQSALIWDADTSAYGSNGIYSSALKKLEIGSGVGIDGNAFKLLTNLETITIPYGTASVPANSFDNCYAIKCIIMPNGITDTFSFVSPNSLQHISFPSTMGGVAVGTPNALRKICVPPTANYAPSCNGFSVIQAISMPSGVTSINKNHFNQCYSLRRINLPNTITSIGQTAFSYCYALETYDFSSFNSIPTLGTNAFLNANTKAKIIVPDALYEDWIVASNWSYYSSRIVKASEA